MACLCTFDFSGVVVSDQEIDGTLHRPPGTTTQTPQAELANVSRLPDQRVPFGAAARYESSYLLVDTLPECEGTYSSTLEDFSLLTACCLMERTASKSVKNECEGPTVLVRCRRLSRDPPGETTSPCCPPVAIPLSPQSQDSTPSSTVSWQSTRGSSDFSGE